MNEPTISARSVSLPGRSLCRWVDTVTVETSGRVSMKIYLRKWVKLSPPISWSYSMMEVRVLTVGCKSDLDQNGIRNPHGLSQMTLLGQEAFLTTDLEWEIEKAGQGGGNVVALFVNSWCQGHKVMFCVYIHVRYTHIHNIHVRDEPSGITLQTKLSSSDKISTKWNSIDLHELENKIMPWPCIC